MRPEHPVALITGASWGIGEATAKILAESGFYLLLGARTVEKVTALAEELQSKHGIKAIGTALDVRTQNLLTPLLNWLKASLGQFMCWSTMLVWQRARLVLKMRLTTSGNR